MVLKRGKKVIKKQKELGNPLLSLLLCLDDLCHGRSVGQKIRREVIILLLSLFTLPQNKSEEVLDTLGELLSADQQMSQIKRSFPQFSEDPFIFVDLLRQNSPLPGLLLSVLYLSNMQKEEDLVKDMLELGDTLFLIGHTHSLEKCYTKLRSNERIIPEHLAELEFLRHIASEFSLAGSFTTLPFVTVGLTEKSVEYVEIIAAIKRFPVLEELESMSEMQQEKLEELLSDIDDIFKDFAQGDIRKSALANFPILCTSYANLSK